MRSSSTKPVIIKFIPGITWFILVLVLICLPGSTLPTPETWLNYIFYDKWIHCGLFGMLTFLFIYPTSKLQLSTQAKKNTAIKIAVATWVWALTTEFIQKYFIAGRNFDIYDWGADTLGILLALAWCWKKYLK